MPFSLVRGAILAGGAARRMDGRPKGLLTVGGVRILDRLVTAFHEAQGALPLLVANAPDAAAWRGDLRVVADRTAGAGTLGGLLTAVLETPAPVVVVAWDMPFVTAGLIAALGQALEGFDACLPASGGPRGMEPLAAAYGGATGPAMADAIDRGDLRAIAFHRAVRIRVLSEAELAPYGSPERLFFNVNTADDLLVANGMAS